MAGRRAGIVVLTGVAVVLAVLWARAGGPSWYGVAVIGLFAAKIVLSWKTRTSVARPAVLLRADGVRVGVAVTVYNEDPELLAACLGSLLAQSYPLERVVVIDDCSPDRRALAEAHTWRDRFHQAGVDLVVEEFGVNQGKRHALMRALELQPDVDALLGVDSDTVLAPEAVAGLVRVYDQPGVTVVTGLVLALNYNRNLLTRLIDLRYAQAFLVDRGAQSRFGQVLCACGSLALYSAAVLRKYRPDFLNQRFLGAPAIFGDDRRLTNYCLLEGRALMEETAVAWTAVPEKMGHFLRQQIRWNKSFFRESLWVLRAMPIRKPAFWFTFVELAGWIVFTGTLAWALIVAPLLTSKLLIGPYALYLALMAYGRAFRYPELAHVRPSVADRVLGFALAPIYGLLHVGVLLWLRVYALATLRRGAWGTRKTVEVTLDRPNRHGLPAVALAGTSPEPAAPTVPNQTDLITP